MIPVPLSPILTSLLLLMLLQASSLLRQLSSDCTPSPAVTEAVVELMQLCSDPLPVLDVLVHVNSGTRYEMEHILGCLEACIHLFLDATDRSMCIICHL